VRAAVRQCIAWGHVWECDIVSNRGMVHTKCLGLGRPYLGLQVVLDGGSTEAWGQYLK
jgi:hypothetical protein